MVSRQSLNLVRWGDRDTVLLPVGQTLSPEGILTGELVRVSANWPGTWSFLLSVEGRVSPDALVGIVEARCGSGSVAVPFYATLDIDSAGVSLTGLFPAGDVSARVRIRQTVLQPLVTQRLFVYLSVAPFGRYGETDYA